MKNLLHVVHHSASTHTVALTLTCLLPTLACADQPFDGRRGHAFDTDDDDEEDCGPKGDEEDWPSGDFKNVPRKPGTQTWRIGPKAATMVSGSDGSRMFWTHQRYSEVKFICWDESGKHGVGGSNTGSPGPALSD